MVLTAGKLLIAWGDVFLFHGGVCLAVRDTIPSTMISPQALDAGEFLRVLLPASQVMCLQRPAHVHDGGLSESIAKACVRDTVLLAVGGFNEQPPENQPICAGHGCFFAAKDRDSEDLLPTRWQSRRCIDYMMVTVPSARDVDNRAIDWNDTWAFKCPEVYTDLIDHNMVGFHVGLGLVNDAQQFLQPHNQCTLH